MQERRNSSALAMELRLSCIKPSIHASFFHHEMKLVVEHHNHGKLGPTQFYIVNIIAAEALATQVARASAAMLLTYFALNNPGLHSKC